MRSGMWPIAFLFLFPLLAGPGKAYQVEVEGGLKGTARHVTSHRLDRNLGTLQPGQSATAEVTLKADEGIESGKVTLRFEAKDRYERVHYRTLFRRPF